MSAIDLLKQALGRANIEVLRNFSIAKPAAIDAETQRLQAWLGGAGGGSLPPRDLIQEAVMHFCRSRRLSHLRDARLVSFGCIEAIGDRGYRLIEDAERFGALLSCVDEYRPQPRAFRKCYRGLLSGYFAYDPEASSARPAGKDNWGKLRSYLTNRLSNISAPGTAPAWVTAIEEHDNLLSDDPCRQYGLAALGGDDSILQELRSRLEVTDASWVMRKLLMAQVDAAVAQSDDSKFTALIPRVLELLSTHSLHLGDGLAKVLARYRANTRIELNPALRDFAVTNWGNPWLQLNAAKWGRVEEPVRQMVAAWLKLDFIRQFFGLLAEDRTSDPRRLQFWEQYVDSIDDMYFALGSYASTNQSSDFKTLRRKMEGRRLDLYKGGSPLNNAFIMMMGEYAVVEFGVTGNACFIFERNTLPFELNSHVTADSIRHATNVGRYLHMDTGRGRRIPWERNFADVLARMLPKHTQSSDPKKPVSYSWTSASNQQASDTPLAVNGVRIERQFSTAGLQDFARSHNLRLLDHRNAGGALWVDTGNTNRVVAEQLKAWGFRYSENKGRWWKER